ncbi:MAG: YjbQ family protein, partial [Anaerolineae bacterium]
MTSWMASASHSSTGAPGAQACLPTQPTLSAGPLPMPRRCSATAPCAIRLAAGARLGYNKSRPRPGKEQAVMVELEIRTQSHSELRDITSQVRQAVSDQGVAEGVCHVFVPHTTAGLTLNENWDPDVR